MKQERLDYLTGKYEAKLNPSNEDENTADLADREVLVDAA